MSTDISVHRVKKVDIENLVHDTFETIKIKIINEDNEQVTVCLFADINGYSWKHHLKTFAPREES